MPPQMSSRSGAPESVAKQVIAEVELLRAGIR